MGESQKWLKGNLSKVIVFLADLVFYADYYNLLETVRGQIERWAKSVHHLLQDIRQEPVFWVGLSRLLRSKDIFCYAKSRWSEIRIERYGRYRTGVTQALGSRAMAAVSPGDQATHFLTMFSKPLK